jgi:hypothetical protein
VNGEWGNALGQLAVLSWQIAVFLVYLKYKQVNMRTLSISISDLEFSKFGLKKEKLSFSELLDMVSNELTKKALHESVELAEKYNLSGLKMDDISEEVKATRENAKNHS